LKKSFLTRFTGYLSFTRDKGAIPALDGLRGIAILLVLARHGARVFEPERQAVLPIFGWDLIIPFENGWAGVDLFFVLSGFLITHHLAKHGPPFSKEFLKKYFTKRILRIFPAYYFFLAVVSLGLLPFYRPAQEGLKAAVYTHLFFFQDYLGSGIVPAFWSIAVEERFYLVAPSLLLLAFSTRIPGGWRGTYLLLFLFSLAGRAIAFAGHQGTVQYDAGFWILRSPFHCCLDGLAAGCICALLYRARSDLVWTQNPRVLWTIFYSGLLLLCLLLVPFPLLRTFDWFRATALLSLLAIGFATVLLPLVLPQGPSFRLLNSQALLFFSKISYSLYLVHMVFVRPVYELLKHEFHIGSWPVPAQFALFFPLYCCISIGGALFLHYGVEKPFLILKDRIRP
jgi:peptidoglycan/LPS O-acetylase OafA/YrhL